jgi:phage gpG-like protein
MTKLGSYIDTNVQIDLETNFDLGKWENYFDEKLSKDAMLECKDIIFRGIEKRFRTESGPDGEKWDPLKPTFQQRVGSGILTGRGRLRKNFEWVLSGDEVVIFTKEPHASVHNYGARYMTTPRQSVYLWANVFGRQGGIPSHGFAVELPKRTFMGFDKEIEKQIEQAFIKVMKASERIGT